MLNRFTGLFQLQIGVSTHKTIDKLLTEPVLSCLSGSNPRSTSYTHIPIQKRGGVRPWGLVTWGQIRIERMFSSRHVTLSQISWTVFTIVHITVEVVGTCLESNPHLLKLNLHNRRRRNPRWWYHWYLWHRGCTLVCWLFSIPCQWGCLRQN